MANIWLVDVDKRYETSYYTVNSSPILFCSIDPLMNFKIVSLVCPVHFEFTFTMYMQNNKIKMSEHKRCKRSTEWTKCGRSTQICGLFKSFDDQKLTSGQKHVFAINMSEYLLYTLPFLGKYYAKWSATTKASLKNMFSRLLSNNIYHLVVYFLIIYLPISKDTNFPRGSNFSLRAFPICRTISPLRGAGSSTHFCQASSAAFTQVS